MGHQAEDRKRLASLLNELAVYEGPQRTLIEGVELSRRSQPSQRIPVVYQPNIVIVGQGRKRCYLGGQVYQYDPFNYLVLSVPLPAESEWEASPEEPVLILAINPDPAMLGEMILDLDEPLPPAGPISRGISTTPMSEELSGAAIRLDRAKRLMAHDGYNASTAARAVGYEGPSQFSREFKRLFGVTPVEEAEQARARLVES